MPNVTTTVTLKTFSAEVTSHTMHGGDTTFSCDMVVGISTDAREGLVKFEHRTYEGAKVNPNAVVSQRKITMPSTMADRLIDFAKYRFRRSEVPDYDGFDFTRYLNGVQGEMIRDFDGPRLDSKVVDAVQSMGHYTIGVGGTGEVVKTFIGLDGGSALSVLGRQRFMAVLTVGDLMRAYGAKYMGQIIH